MAYVGTPRYLGSDQATLASIIQGEAGNQGLVGMQAVGAVISNRAASNFSGYGGDVISQALAPRQFQGQNANYSQNAWDVAGNVLNGTNPDPTGGATSYANPSTSTPGNWGSRLTPQNSLQIGDHFFTDNQNGVPFTPNVGSGIANGPADTSSGLAAGPAGINPSTGEPDNPFAGSTVGASSGGFAPIGDTGFARTDQNFFGPFTGASADASSFSTDGSAGGPGFSQAGSGVASGAGAGAASTGSAGAGAPTSSSGSSSGGEGKATTVVGVSNTFFGDLNTWISQTLQRFGAAFQTALGASENSIATFFGGIANWFTRGFLIILGAVLIILAIIAMTGRSVTQVVAKGA